MTSDDAEKELWKFANVITGFSVTQSLGVAIALGSALHDSLQTLPCSSKFPVALIALVYMSLYCGAVSRCQTLSKRLNSQIPMIWREATVARFTAICAGIVVFLFGLFAPEIARWLA